MTDDNDFRDDLVSLLVNGMRIDWMNLKDSLDVIDFTVSLKEHYMKDLKLSHLFFWTDDNVILHDQNGLESTFAVVISHEALIFRTSDGTIDNQKNAGRILMSTIAFIHNKLEEMGLVEAKEGMEGTIFDQAINKYDKKEEEHKDDNNEEEPSEDSSSDPDFEWI